MTSRRPYAASGLSPHDAQQKWPDGHVPYCIHGSGDIGLSSTDQAFIDARLAEIAAVTPLHFDKFNCGSAQPASFLDYRAGGTDGDQTGGGLTRPGADHPGTTIFLWTVSTHVVLHETGHAVGYMHEHMRSDRDSFLFVGSATSITAHVATRPTPSTTWRSASRDGRSTATHPPASSTPTAARTSRCGARSTSRPRTIEPPRGLAVPLRAGLALAAARLGERARDAAEGPRPTPFVRSPTWC